MAIPAAAQNPFLENPKDREARKQADADRAASERRTWIIGGSVVAAATIVAIGLAVRRRRP